MLRLLLTRLADRRVDVWLAAASAAANVAAEAYRAHGGGDGSEEGLTDQGGEDFLIIILFLYFFLLLLLQQDRKHDLRIIKWVSSHQFLNSAMRATFFNFEVTRYHTGSSTGNVGVYDPLLKRETKRHSLQNMTSEYLTICTRVDVVAEIKSPATMNFPLGRYSSGNFTCRKVC